MGTEQNKGLTDALVAKYGLSRNGHAHFAPSAAAMWLTCSGSLLVNARAGDDAGIEAATGTVAHHVAEIWNQTGKRPDYMIGTVEVASAGGSDYQIPIDDDMLFHVGRYVQWCNEVPGDHYFEQRIDFSELTPIPNQRGTADHFACQPGILTITDLKFGTGVRVYADNNPQAMLYAAGAFLQWDWIYGFQKIVIRICQPRLDVFEVFECSRKELLEFMDYVKVRAKAAWVENAPRTPSPKACQWCAGKAKCPARILELEAVVDAAFDTDDDLDGEPKTYDAKTLQNPKAALAKLAHTVARAENKPIPDLSTHALALTLTYRSHFRNFFNAVAEELLDRAEKGEDVPYFKLVDGRKTRKWKDHNLALATLMRTWGLKKAEAAPATLLSVNKMEKLVKIKSKAAPKEIKESLVSVVAEFAGKRALAAIKDDRPSADDLPDDFDTEDDDEEI